MYSGYNDKYGTPINHGDIVEFYYCELKGYPCCDNTEGYTRMVDVCYRDPCESTFMLISESGWGNYIERHNKHCKVIGHVDTHRHLLADFPDGVIDQLFDD